MKTLRLTMLLCIALIPMLGCGMDEDEHNEWVEASIQEGRCIGTTERVTGKQNSPSCSGTAQSVQGYRHSSAYWREDKNGEIWIHGNACKRWIGYGERAWTPIPTEQAAYWIDKHFEITNQARHKWDFSEMVNIDGRRIVVHCSQVRSW